MLERRAGAKPSWDVGPWKHVEDVEPYATWEKPIPSSAPGGPGRVATVLVEDARVNSDSADYWAHAEVYEKRGNAWEFVAKADEYIGDADTYDGAIRKAKAWMRDHKNWQGEHGRYAQGPADREFNFGGEFW